MPSCHWSASSDILHVWYWCPPVTDQHRPIYYMYVIGAALSLISIFRCTTCMLSVPSYLWSASSDIPHVCYRCPLITHQHLPIYHMYVIGAPYHWSASSDILHVWYWYPPVTDQHLPMYYMYGIGILLSLISIFQYTTCMLSVPPITDQHLPINHMYVIGTLLSLISIFRYTTCM